MATTTQQAMRVRRNEASLVASIGYQAHKSRSMLPGEFGTPAMQAVEIAAIANNAPRTRSPIEPSVPAFASFSHGCETSSALTAGEGPVSAANLG
jgi:hypothetical protein